MLSKFDCGMLIIVGALAFYFVDEPQSFTLIYISVCFYSLTRTWREPNIQATIVILLLMRLLEYWFYPLIEPFDWGNYIIYPFYIVIDILVISLLIFRAPFLRYLDRGNEVKYFVTQADMVIGALFVFYLYIDFLALFEHCLRHLDDFGLDPESLVVRRFNENAMNVYNIFPYVKHLLNSIELCCILFAISNWMAKTNNIKLNQIKM